MAEIRASRLENLLEKSGMSQSELARRVGIKQPSIGRLISGQTKSTSVLTEIARELRTTPEYLTGESDSMFETRAAFTPANASHHDEILIPELDIAYSMGGGSAIDDYQEKKLIPFPKTWLRPMIGGNFDQVFVARGSGDSMLPTLLDGDIIIIDTAQRSIDRQDALWAISYGDLGMVKRVRKTADGGYQINSDNPAVSAIMAYDDEMHVIGRVIWLGRRM